MFFPVISVSVVGLFSYAPSRLILPLTHKEALQSSIVPVFQRKCLGIDKQTTRVAHFRCADAPILPCPCDVQTFVLLLKRQTLPYLDADSNANSLLEGVFRLTPYHKQDRPGIACLIIDKHTVLLHLDRERASKRLTDSNQSIQKSTPRRQKDAKRPQGYPEIPFRLKLNKMLPQNAVCNLIFLIFRQLRIPECVGFPPSSLYRSTPVSLPLFRP